MEQFHYKINSSASIPITIRAATMNGDRIACELIVHLAENVMFICIVCKSKEAAGDSGARRGLVFNYASATLPSTERRTRTAVRRAHT